jgi:hypothetical protein
VSYFLRIRLWLLIPWLLVALPQGTYCQEAAGEAQAPATSADICKSLPGCCRDHVYIFLVNGLDPVNYGKLTGLRDHLNQLGFRQTYYGQIFHVPYFKKEIRRIHREDSEAHFILVGFSVGANMVHAMAESVGEDGVTIDGLVYLSGNNYVTPVPSSKPANVQRVVNVLASGPLKFLGEVGYAENVRLPDSWHFGSPGHARTKELLAREVANAAAAVPVPEMPTQPMPTISGEPTPRPVKALKTSMRDNWDFLKPVARLDEPRSPAAEVPIAPAIQAADGRVRR